MEARTIKLDREKLYEEVWETPINKLAPKYGISNVGLSKICRKLNIPTPPRSYWVKLEHGHKVERPPLLDTNPGEPETYSLGIENEAPSFGNEAQRLMDKEKDEKAQIRVPERLRNPHPLARV